VSVSSSASGGTSNSDGGNAASTNAEPADAANSPRPLDPLITNLAEIEEYLANYLAAKRDEIKATARRALIVTTAAISIGVVSLTILGGATILLLDGLAKAVAAGAGAQVWVGEIIVGGGAIILALVAAVLGTRSWFRASCQATKRKYEQRHRMQRTRFGTDSADRAVT
jgi:hypothetical protein